MQGILSKSIDRLLLGASSEGCQRVSGLSSQSLNWAELLKPENGGPGDSPGRAEAVKQALAAAAERKCVKDAVQDLKMKKKRGKG